MKFSKLLVLSVLSLFGLGAQAVELIERTAPEAPATTTVDVASLDKTPATFVVGNYYVIFNKGAQQYFGEGNAWGTQASLSDTPNLARFTLPAGKTLEDATLLFNDYSAAKGAWKLVFFDSATAMFVDRGSQANYYWQIVAGGEPNTYRLQASPSNPTLNPTNNPGFVGVAEAAAAGSALSPFLASGWIDWEFYTVPEWNEYGVAKDIFDKSQELKLVIEAAEAEGVDVTAAANVYNNVESTLDQMVQAVNDLEFARKNSLNGATADSPKSATAFITNPTFENASSDGWLGTGPNMVGSGAHGPANVAEHYNKTFDTYQTLEALPKGVYELGVTAFYRGSFSDYQKGTNRNAFIYARQENDTLTAAVQNPWEAQNTEPMAGSTEWGVTASELSETVDGTTYYIPNDPSAGRLYFEKGYYKTRVFFAVEGDTARIGIRKDVAVTNDWTVFDNFSLTYYGNEEAAYGKWLSEFKKGVKDYSGAFCSNIYLEGINSVMEFTQASNKEQVLACEEIINNAVDSVEHNIALWKEFQSVLADAIAVVANDALDPDYTAELGEWIEYDTEDILSARKLLNAELEALIAQKKAEIEEAKKHPISETDATNLLTNPDFDDARGATYGWTGFKSAYQIKWGNGKTSFQMPTDGGTSTNKCAEAFSTTDFDLYQVVENAPVGVYEISVQGFCRNGRGDTAWNNYQNQTYYSQPGKFPVYVYLNDAQTPFVNVFSEPVEEGYYKSVDSGSEVYVKDGFEFPDGMKSSAVAFSAGMYTQKAYGLVAKEGDAMRIGVKGTSAGLDGEDDNWVIFDNFKLTWKGFQAAVIKPVLEEQIEKAKETKLLAMDQALYNRLVTAISDAEASITAGVGKVMFNCLSDLYEIDAKVNASKLVFAELEKANKNLANEIEVAKEAGRTSALADASTLNDDITNGIANHTIAEDAVNFYITLINGVISRLRLPNQDVIDAASDATPVDMTSVINNPTYDEGVSGWSGDEAAYGGDQGAIAELFNKNFNYYQEFSGLPAGTYEVSVQAFYRSGSAVNDYDKLDSIHTSHAFLYAAAINGTDSVMNAKAIQRLASITKNEAYIAEGFVQSVEESKEGYAVAHTDTIKDTDPESYLRTFVPNTMSTANDQFMNGYFADNKVIVKLAEGETMRIGLLKTTLLENDWTIFDNWTMTYYGKNSAKSATGDNVTAIRTLDNQGETVKVEFFTLDGRKAGAAQKGLIIMKQTLDNGSIIVKKIRK